MTTPEKFCLPWPSSPPQLFPLASRPDTLTGTTVVLVDNGRLGHPVYEGFQTALIGLLTKNGARAVDLQFPLIGYSAQQLETAASDVAELRPQAAVIALGEAGISQPTVQFAIELEKRGIATVGLYIDPGVSMARAVAASVMPGLPVIDLAIRPHEFKGRGDEIAGNVASRIVAAISQTSTNPGEPLLEPSAPPAAPLFPPGSEVELAWTRATARADAGKAALEFLRECERYRIGDGLPLIPPTRQLVMDMCASVSLSRETVLIGATPPSGAAVTVELAAVNAVMAGCEPAHFPCVLAALSAMAAPQYRLGQAVVTTHPGTHVILISGPLAAQAGVSSGAGCLGPGHRANLTIGRAINLCMMNVLRSLPGVSDLGTLGSAAEISTCFADQAFGTWSAWHQERFDSDTSTVFVHRCAPLCNVMDHVSKTAEGVLGSVAAASATVGWNNAYNPSELLVVLCPDHAEIVQQQGWSRADVRQYLFETARNPRHRLRGRGFAPSWPPWFDSLDPVPVVNRAEDIIVVVAGGQGPQSQVGLPWGLSQPALIAVGQSGEMRPSAVSAR